MASSCVSEKGEAGLSDPSVLIDLVSVGLFSIMIAYTWIANARPAPYTAQASDGTVPSAHSRAGLAAPSFGIGGAPVVYLMCSIALLLAAPKMVLFLSLLAANDDRAKEFACQLSGYSIGSLIVYVLFGLMTPLILIFNGCRVRTRFHMSALVTQYMKPVASTPRADSNSEGAQKPVLAVLPAYRGVWVTPFADAFRKACEAQASQADVVAFDAYGTDLCPESDAWIRHNMRYEAVDDVVRVGWCNFVKIPLPDNSVDVITCPFGTKIPYANGQRDSKKRQAAKLQTVLREMHRVLKPGGTLVSGNFVTSVAAWQRSLVEAGFEASAIHTLPTWYWASFIPAKVTVVSKSITDSAPCENSSSDMLELTAPSEVDLSNFSLCPPGKQFRARNIILLIFACLYIIYIGITYALVTSLLWPTFLPWSVSVATLLTGNASTWPFILYFLALDLTRIARGEDSDENEDKGSRAVSSVVAQSRASLKASAEVPLLDAARQASVSNTQRSRNEWEDARCRAVWQHFWRELYKAALGFTALAVVFWVPGFVFDLIVVKAFGVTDFNTLDQYSGIFLPIFYIVLVYSGMAVYKRIAARKEVAMQHAEADEQRVLAASAHASP